MAEKLIYLEGVDPVDFYGVNNVRFNKFIELFLILVYGTASIYIIGWNRQDSSAIIRCSPGSIYVC